MNKISIIIPVFNGLLFLKECIKSIIKNCSYENFEVIIVDDNSEIDNMETYYNEIKEYPNFKIIRNNKNLGFAKTNNIGFKNCSGDYVYLLNSDTIVMPGFLSEAMDCALKNNFCAVQSLLLEPTDNNKIIVQSCGAQFNENGDPVYILHGIDPNDITLKSNSQIDSFIGCGVLINKKELLKVDGFDEKYGKYYYEDSDLALKLKKNTCKFGFSINSQIIHFHGLSTNSYIKKDNEYNLNIQISSSRFKKKWPKEKIFEIIKH